MEHWIKEVFTVYSLSWEGLVRFHNCPHILVIFTELLEKEHSVNNSPNLNNIFIIFVLKWNEVNGTE